MLDFRYHGKKETRIKPVSIMYLFIFLMMQNMNQNIAVFSNRDSMLEIFYQCFFISVS